MQLLRWASKDWPPFERARPQPHGHCPVVRSTRRSFSIAAIALSLARVPALIAFSFWLGVSSVVYRQLPAAPALAVLEDLSHTQLVRVLLHLFWRLIAADYKKTEKPSHQAGAV